MLRPFVPSLCIDRGFEIEEESIYKVSSFSLPPHDKYASILSTSLFSSLLLDLINIPKKFSKQPYHSLELFIHLSTMQLSLLFTALLAFTGMTLAAPIEDVAAAPLPLEKRAYSVCCQTIVGGDLTLGTGTAFNCMLPLSQRNPNHPTIPKDLADN